MRRREVITGLIGVAATSSFFGGHAIGQPRLPQQRVGFLHPGRPTIASMRAASFRQGLAVAGGRGDAWELVMKVAEEKLDRLPGMASDLIALDVHAIAAVSPSAMNAAREATRTIPIVAVDLESDPIASGWAESLARPGGNVTGIFLDLPELGAKCLQLLREAAPGLTHLGVLWDPGTGSVPLTALQVAASALRVGMEVHEVRRSADFDAALRTIAQAQRSSVLILPSPLFSGNLQLLGALTMAHRLPAITLFPEFAQHGGLLAYGPDLGSLFRQAGVLTRKVLDGTGPSELPIERPDRFQLAVNLKTAAVLNLSVGTSVLLLADEVIE
jgi:putative tryptophan/tyrosine transport system substrate-binding protein